MDFKETILTLCFRVVISQPDLKKYFSLTLARSMVISRGALEVGKLGY